MRNLAATAPELSPVRAQLAYLLEQQAERVGKRTAIIEATKRLKAAEQGEIDAKVAIDALSTEEAAAMGKWAAEGGPMPAPDTAKRQALTEALASATAVGNAARAAGADMLEQAMAAQAEIIDIADEVQSAIHGALVASIDPIFSELEELEKRRRKLIARPLALVKLLTDGGNRFDHADDKRIQFLNRALDIKTRLTPFLLEAFITNADVDAQTGPFVRLAARLAEDPSAALED